MNPKDFTYPNYGYSISYGVCKAAEPIVPANLKPFNLEAALAGDPVVTRNGRKVTQIFKFDAYKSSNPVCAVIDGMIRVYKASGRYFGLRESDHDLFMAKKERTVYVNVYPADRAKLSPVVNPSGRVGAVYETEAQADAQASEARVGKAIPVTFFE